MAVVSFVLLGWLAVFGRTVVAQSDACRVGQELGPGDHCTVDIPNISAGTNRFEVRSDGTGCYGFICSDNAMDLNGFKASRMAGTLRWRIDAVPEGGGTNRAPQPTGSIPAQTLTVGGGATSVSVERYFTDPDGDALTYSAGSDGTGVVRASAAGSTVVLTPVAAGTATVTVTARDPDGASATQSIAVTVEEDGGTNRPPRPTGSIPGQTLTVGGVAVSVDVTRYFTDPDGDALEYSASSTGSGIVTAAVSASVVTLAPVAAGAATVTVSARDPAGASAAQSIAVTVRPSTTPTSDRAVLEALYDATGGANWTDDTNWKSSAPLGEWHGVTTDADGRVTELFLGGNSLTGSIPRDLGRLDNLEYLVLQGNELTGRVPGELGDLGVLRELFLDGNDLSGPIPDELRKLANLESLFLGGNELSGPVPGWLGNLAQLKNLDLDSNGLSGPIPDDLQYLVQLERLALGWNGLSGPVPTWLGNMVRLEALGLGGNAFGGPIPGELQGLVNLDSLSLGWNELTGPVPTWLGNLVRLEVLDLRDNGLTGPIPAELGSLTNLEWLTLERNDLTGGIPAELGNLTNLEWLDLSDNDLTGPIPAELGNLMNLERLDLSHAWSLSGALPAGLEQSALEELDVFVTRTCAPPAWREWLATIEFYGPLCEAETDGTIDVAVVYTPAALEAAGGAAAIEASIDLMIAETNEAYAASGLRQRLALVGRSEVPYAETYSWQDVDRLRDPSDGHLDEVHALRDAVGADLVHLIVGDPWYDVCGIAAGIPGVFGLTLMECGGLTFAHELGHNMGLRHDRFQVDVFEGRVSSHPAYGYVNRRVLDAGAPPSSRWTTIMSYDRHCRLADVTCSVLPRFSNPRQHYGGDLLGVPFGTGSGLTGPSDAVAVLEAMGPAVAMLRDRPDGAANRPPVAAGTLPDRTLESADATLYVDLSQAFADPDGDALTYTASSTAPWVLRARAAGAVVTLTAAGEGATTIRVTATDPGGLSVSQSFSATVDGPSDRDPQGSAESDRAALEALYDATDGPGWTESTSWKTSAPLGEWYGVTTDADGRVTGLDLHDNGLDGFIAPELGSLGALESLSLGSNYLTGPIPAGVGNLARLRRLDLSGRWGATGLTGPIPAALGALTALESLFLHRNRLTGPIPAALGALANLESLSLGGNALTGPIPGSLGNLARLRSLGLDSNELTGPIPRQLGRLASLKSLSLARNKLTGSIPGQLGDLSHLEMLELGGNELTGRIPPELGNLASLRELDLSYSDLSGPVPGSLGSLSSLERLDLAYAWGLSGPLPAGLEQSALEGLDILVTRTCAPSAWREWLATIEFLGPRCASDRGVTIDVVVAYTPAAREAAGGIAAIEAEIDLMVAETNEAFAASGVQQRVALTGRSEVPYAETFSDRDLYQLADPEDGELDEVHALLDRTGADLVHLIVDRPYDVCGIAFLPMLGWPGPFAITLRDCGGIVFAHELGHNLGLRHDRFQEQVNQGGVSSHPGYGYVNQRMFESGAPPSSRWTTIMAYEFQCELADARCARPLRFSNPHQRHDGDPLGVAFGAGSGVTGASDAAAVLNATGPAAAAWGDRPPRVNRAPVAVGTLPDRRLGLHGGLTVDVSPAFDDPDGDALAYGASSSAPDVVTVRAAGGRVTLTAVGEGAAAIRVTATDPGGLSAAQSFSVTVAAAPAPFTDDPIRPGVTPIRAIHFAELRTRIDALRVAAGLGRFRWTDSVLTAGVTRVRLAHLLELREALGAAYTAAGRPAPRWADTAPARRATPIRAAHVTELRAAVLALE